MTLSQWTHWDWHNRSGVLFFSLIHWSLFSSKFCLEEADVGLYRYLFYWTHWDWLSRSGVLFFSLVQILTSFFFKLLAWVGRRWFIQLFFCTHWDWLNRSARFLYSLEIESFFQSGVVCFVLRSDIDWTLFLNFDWLLIKLQICTSSSKPLR